MARPTSAITRFELGTTMQEFDTALDRQGFIGPKVLRPRVVAVQSATLSKVKLKHLLKSGTTRRAPGAPYNRDKFEWDPYSYNCLEDGHEEVLDDAELAIYRDIMDADVIAAERAKDRVLRNYEIAVAAAVFNTSTWNGASLTTAVSTPWSTIASATPVKDVITAGEKVVEGSGLEPNAMIVNKKTWKNLRQNAEILDRIKYAGKDDPKNFGPSAVAEVMGLDMVLVAGGVKNTANEGQDASISRIWGNSYAMVARVATSDDPKEPCLGRTFIWSGDGPGAPAGDSELAVIMEEYREEGVRGSIMRARNNRDIVIFYAQAAHLLSNIGS